MARPGMGAESRWSGEIVGDDIEWTRVPLPDHVPPTEGQLSLLGDTAGPVRPTDPETSLEAAALLGRMTQRALVLDVLRRHGPLHDEAIAETAGLLLGSSTKRRGELVAAGLVEWSGRHTRTSRGSRTRIWQVKACP